MFAELRLQLLRLEALNTYLRRGIVPTQQQVDQYVIQHAPRGLRRSTCTFEPVVPYQQMDVQAVRRSYQALLRDMHALQAAWDQLLDQYERQVTSALRQADTLQQQIARMTAELRERRMGPDPSVWTYEETFADSRRVDTTLTTAVVLYPQRRAFTREIEHTRWYPSFRSVTATADGTPVGDPAWSVSSREDEMWVVFSDRQASTSVDLRLHDPSPVDLVELVPFGQCRASISVSADGIAFYPVAGDFVDGARLFRFPVQTALVVRVTLDGEHAGIRRVRVGYSRSPVASSVYTTEFDVPPWATQMIVERKDAGVRILYSLDGGAYQEYQNAVPLQSTLQVMVCQMTTSEVDGLSRAAAPGLTEGAAQRLQMIRGYRQWQVSAAGVASEGDIDAAFDSSRAALVEPAGFYGSLSEVPNELSAPFAVVAGDGTETLVFPVGRKTTGSVRANALLPGTAYRFRTWLYCDTPRTEIVSAASDTEGHYGEYRVAVRVNGELVISANRPPRSVSGNAQVSLRAGWNEVEIVVSAYSSTVTGSLLVSLPQVDQYAVHPEPMHFVPLEAMLYASYGRMDRVFTVDGSSVAVRPLYMDGARIDGVFTGVAERVRLQYATGLQPHKVRLRLDIEPGGSCRGYRLRFL